MLCTEMNIFLHQVILSEGKDRKRIVDKVCSIMSPIYSVPPEHSPAQRRARTLCPC